MDNETDTEKIKVEFKVGDTPVSMVMAVPTQEVGIRKMLPVLRNVSNSFVSVAEQNVRDSGAEISCRAGCGACCRQLVPVSEAEAFDLREQIEAMPEERRRSITNKFIAGFERFRSAGYFERLEAAASGDEADYERAINEYFTFGIACPFLENESCSIHETRPITCREYLVTSPPVLCSSAEGEGVRNVKHFFKVKEAIISAARFETKEHLPYVPLISVLEWTGDRKQSETRKTGREWITEIFQLLFASRDESVMK